MPTDKSGLGSFPENFGDPNVNDVGRTDTGARKDGSARKEDIEGNKSGGLSTADMARAGERLAATAKSSQAAGQAPGRPLEMPPSSRAESSGPAGGQAGTAAVRQKAPATGAVQLLDTTQSQELRARWDKIQLLFVDEPRRSVQEADALVADTMKRLAEIFARERQSLEGQWDRGGDVSTEELRIVVQRYRSFFDRLLNI